MVQSNNWGCHGREFPGSPETSSSSLTAGYLQGSSSPTKARGRPDSKLALGSLGGPHHQACDETSGKLPPFLRAPSGAGGLGLGTCSLLRSTTLSCFTFFWVLGRVVCVTVS